MQGRTGNFSEQLKRGESQPDAGGRCDATLQILTLHGYASDISKTRPKRRFKLRKRVSLTQFANSLSLSLRHPLNFRRARRLL